MRFSVWPSPNRSWADTLEIVSHAETTGWDGAWFADHFMPNDTEGATPLDGPVLECWAVIAGLAAATERIRLGSLVCGNTYRHPAVLANVAASVDQISGGRLVLGLGAGWQLNEHDAYGIDLGDVKTRLDRFEEACQIVRSLLDGGRTSFEGAHYSLSDAPCEPAPVQQPLPLLVGGGGEKRTLRIAASYADEWNVWGSPEEFAHKAAVLDRHCDEVDREPSRIVRSTQAMVFLSTDEAWLTKHREADYGRAAVVGTPAEAVERLMEYRDAGVDEFIVPDWTMGRVERTKDTLDMFATEVAPHLR